MGLSQIVVLLHPTGNIASAHSPCPFCMSFTLSRSLLICTRSPTANGEADEGEDAEAVDADVDEVDADGDDTVSGVPLLELPSDGTLTLVSTAGLNVHLARKSLQQSRGCNKSLPRPQASS